MRNKELILQIFTGGFKNNITDYEKIIEKINMLIDKININKIIIGWSMDLDMYIKLKEFLHEKNIEIFLWLPVFSEIGELKSAKTVVSWDNNQVKNYSLQEGENFEFYCPSSYENIEILKKVYEENFEEVGFDGVFLDKIRYPSFSNGIGGIFSCFCEKCIEEYEAMGIDVEKIKREINNLVDINSKGSCTFNIESYEMGKYKFTNPLWEEFFNAKNEIIFNSLEDIYKYFKNKNLKVGIDVFAPFLSYFVGQDMNKLQNTADFIKPMMYRITKAPAGLPFEFEKLVEAINFGNSTYTTEERMLEILGVHQYNEEKFDLEFIKREIQYMSNNLHECIYPGIEINRKDKIAETYPDYIKENVTGIDGENVKGFVLSWDLLSAPEDNIEEVINLFGRREE